MMKTSKSIRILILFTPLILLGCIRRVDETPIISKPLIGTYLAEHSEFSGFYKILELSGTLSFLNTYGTYTCFAPTNEAVQKYITAKGKSSINDFTPEELKTLVRYHVIVDTINSTMFTDGKLSTPTMYGQYLTANTYFEDGRTKIKINKYAELLTKDINVENGIIHSINTILEPVVLSIAEQIEQNPEYSFFTAALKETGLYDTLKLTFSNDVEDVNKRWFTVFVNTDAAYGLDGINSYEELRAKYCNTGDPKDPKDSLNLYVAYHILDHSLKYVADLITENAHLTKAPLEVVTIRLNGDTVLVNEDEFNGVLERGAPINRLVSDNTAGNGVFHVVEKNIYIKLRLPIRVNFDVADQPELRKMKGIFRVDGQTTVIQPGQLANITWYTTQTISYVNDAGWNGDYYIYRDYLSIPFRNKLINKMDLKTPLVVKGKYKVWICGRHVWGDRRPRFYVWVNDVQLPNIVDMGVTISKLPDRELELQGYKRYDYREADSTYLTDANGRFVARLAGSIDIATTGNQKITFTSINDSDGGMWLDMIQFIPYDQDQLWPRLDEKGISRDMPSWYTNY